MKNTLTKIEAIDYGKNIVFALGCSFLVISFFAILFQRLDIATFNLVSSDDTATFNKDFFYGCVVAPLIEEFVFRWLPISFALLVFGKSFEKWKWYYAAFLAIIFGFIHYGYFSIYIQGILGFFITYVYYNNKKWMYVCGVITHMAWNFSLYWTLPVMIHFPKPVQFW